MTFTTRRHAAVVGLVAALVAATGCTANPTGQATGSDPAASSGASVSDDPTAPIEIWTDATRQAGFEAYAKAHPDKKIKVTLVDGADLLDKIQLANRAGSGWPDLIWGDVYPYQLASDAYQNFAQPLNDLLPAEYVDGFGDTNQVCTYDGKIYCLRNDVAPSVLFYNTETFAKHGYQVPTTMEEFQKLAEQMAKDDPNLRVQADAFSGMTLQQYYTASGCPFDALNGMKDITINWSDPKCTRVTQMLDKLLACR